jgi:hypothetical protein
MRANFVPDCALPRAEPSDKPLVSRAACRCRPPPRSRSVPSRAPEGRLARPPDGSGRSADGAHSYKSRGTVRCRVRSSPAGSGRRSRMSVSPRPAPHSPAASLTSAKSSATVVVKPGRTRLTMTWSPRKTASWRFAMSAFVLCLRPALPARGFWSFHDPAMIGRHAGGPSNYWCQFLLIRREI